MIEEDSAWCPVCAYITYKENVALYEAREAERIAARAFFDCYFDKDNQDLMIQRKGEYRVARARVDELEKD